MIRVLFVGILMLILGCHGHRKQQMVVSMMEPTFSQYHAPDFLWMDVARVLVLPVLNESIYTRADEEIVKALSAELQQLGRFEVVLAPPDDGARLAAKIHRGGQFDEAILNDLGRSFKADVVIHTTITQYSPYPRPRLGLVIQAVSPYNAKVIGSVDGLWDATRGDIAHRVMAYYRQRPEKPAFIANHYITPDDGYADELALHSPMLFQRFVCAEAVRNLARDFSMDAANGNLSGNGTSGSMNGNIPMNGTGSCPPNDPNCKPGQPAGK